MKSYTLFYINTSVEGILRMMDLNYPRELESLQKVYYCVGMEPFSAEWLESVSNRSLQDWLTDLILLEEAGLIKELGTE